MKLGSARLKVDGMTCISCVRNIEENLTKFNGVCGIMVSLLQAEASVIFDADITTVENISNKIDDMGFDVTVKSSEVSEIKDKVVRSRIRIESDINRNVEKLIESSISSKLLLIRFCQENNFVDFWHVSSIRSTEILSTIKQHGISGVLDLEQCPTSRIIVRVNGMTCQSCVDNIESTVGKRQGVISIKVFLEKSEAHALVDASLVSSDVEEMINDMGFDSQTIFELFNDSYEGKSNKVSKKNDELNTIQLILSTTITIKALKSVFCIFKIENHMRALPGIENCSVNLIEETGMIDYDSGSWNIKKIRNEIESLGYLTELPKQNWSSIRQSSAVSLNEESKSKCYLRITGMTCSSCVNKVESHLMKVEGVKSVLVALLAMKCEIIYDSAYVMPFQLSNRVKELGFNAEVIENGHEGIGVVHILIQGMTCSSCVNHIEKHIGKIKGIVSINVSLSTSKGKVEYFISECGPRDVIDAINDMGFDANLCDDRESNHAAVDHINQMIKQ